MLDESIERPAVPLTSAKFQESVANSKHDFVQVRSLAQSQRRKPLRQTSRVIEHCEQVELRINDLLDTGVIPVGVDQERPWAETGIKVDVGYGAHSSSTETIKENHAISDLWPPREATCAERAAGTACYFHS